MSGKGGEDDQSRPARTPRRRTRQSGTRGPLHTAYPRPRPGRNADTSELDLDDYLGVHPEETWVAQAGDGAMRAAGIRRGDYVLVDLQASALSDGLVAVRAEGLIIVRELRLTPCPQLLSRSRDYPPVILGGHPELDIIGPVIALLRLWH